MKQFVMKINARNKAVLPTLGLTNADNVLYITYSVHTVP